MTIILRWLAPYLMKGAAIVGLLLGAWFYVKHVENAARASQKAADAAVVREATLQAEKAALASARAQEAHSAANTREANDKLVSEMVSAHDSLDRYVRLHRLPAQGGSCNADMPTTADAASVIDRADRVAVLDDDLRRCTDIAARLINARDWANKELTQ